MARSAKLSGGEFAGIDLPDIPEKGLTGRCKGVESHVPGVQDEAAVCAVARGREDCSLTATIAALGIATVTAYGDAIIGPPVVLLECLLKAGRGRPMT